MYKYKRKKEPLVDYNLHAKEERILVPEIDSPRLLLQGLGV
jgi:hypothetical protein